MAACFLQAVWSVYVFRSRQLCLGNLSCSFYDSLRRSPIRHGAVPTPCQRATSEDTFNHAAVERHQTKQRSMRKGSKCGLVGVLGGVHPDWLWHYFTWQCWMQSCNPQTTVAHMFHAIPGRAYGEGDGKRHHLLTCWYCLHSDAGPEWVKEPPWCIWGSVLALEPLRQCGWLKAGGDSALWEGCSWILVLIPQHSVWGLVPERHVVVSKKPGELLLKKTICFLKRNTRNSGIFAQFSHKLHSNAAFKATSKKLNFYKSSLSTFLFRVSILAVCFTASKLFPFDFTEDWSSR